ncbi:MAG: hypothetical protein H6Q89_5140 [Myxococcaceae bacterium]|nr:hypothetical protein [Myxococcaceae bacterium]
MALRKLIDEAGARLEDASKRIVECRARPPSAENQQQWLTALTDYLFALAELHQFTNESVHEKLHQLAGVTGLKAF